MPDDIDPWPTFRALIQHKQWVSHLETELDHSQNTLVDTLADLCTMCDTHQAWPATFPSIHHCLETQSLDHVDELLRCLTPHLPQVAEPP